VSEIILSVNYRINLSYYVNIALAAKSIVVFLRISRETLEFCAYLQYTHIAYDLVEYFILFTCDLKNVSKDILSNKPGIFGTIKQELR
jgi:hypothetical protein